MLRALFCLFVSTSLGFAQNAKKAAEQPFAWVSPMQNAEWAKKSLPATVKHATFKSASMGVEVGYYIYLPPGYETSQEKYPVVYHLHGGRPGSESKAVRLASYVDAAIPKGHDQAHDLCFPKWRAGELV
jgi:predicted peptidase